MKHSSSSPSYSGSLVQDLDKKTASKLEISFPNGTVIFKISKCILAAFIFGLNWVAKAMSILEQIQSHNYRKKQFLCLYPPPAMVAVTSPSYKGLLSPVL